MEDINFIIIMLQLKSPKAKNTFNSVQKSNTAVALPTIHKTITYSQSNHSYNRSPYLEIAQNLSTNIEYDKKNTIYINKEQNKLKSILKKMNIDTMDMINNIKPRRAQRTKSRSQLSTLAEKEVENSKKMISNMQFQISKLKEKYTRIIDHAEGQNVIEKIKSIKDQIQMMKQENMEARLSVDKEGNTIIKQFETLEDPKIKTLETDAHLTDLRLNTLRGQTTRVEDETKILNTRIKQLETKTKSLQEQYNSLKSKQQEQLSLKNRELLMKEKKYQIINMKQKYQEKNMKAKQKYYKILKTLEQLVVSDNSTQAKISQIQKKCSQAKEQSTLLEAELRQAKRVKMERSRVVQQYLSSQQKLVDISKVSNEFISENSTDFLKPEHVKSQFQELAEQKDLKSQLDLLKKEKRQKVDSNRSQVAQVANSVIKQSRKEGIDADSPIKINEAQADKLIEAAAKIEKKASQHS